MSPGLDMTRNCRRWETAIVNLRTEPQRIKAFGASLRGDSARGGYRGFRPPPLRLHIFRSRTPPMHATWIAVFRIPLPGSPVA